MVERDYCARRLVHLLVVVTLCLVARFEFHAKAMDKRLFRYYLKSSISSTPTAAAFRGLGHPRPCSNALCCFIIFRVGTMRVFCNEPIQRLDGKVNFTIMVVRRVAIKRVDTCSTVVVSIPFAFIVKRLGFLSLQRFLTIARLVVVVVVVIVEWFTAAAAGAGDL